MVSTQARIEGRIGMRPLRWATPLAAVYLCHRPDYSRDYCSKSALTLRCGDAERHPPSAHALPPHCRVAVTFARPVSRRHRDLPDISARVRTPGNAWPSCAGESRDTIERLLSTSSQDYTDIQRPRAQWTRRGCWSVSCSWNLRDRSVSPARARASTSPLAPSHRRSGVGASGGRSSVAWPRANPATPRGVATLASLLHQSCRSGPGFPTKGGRPIQPRGRPPQQPP
jgi:hypothetical protein